VVSGFHEAIKASRCGQNGQKSLFLNLQHTIVE